MPRKRSISGRKRTTPSLITLTNQVNKQLNKLKRSGEYGKYASKSIIKLASESKKLKFNPKSYKQIKIKKSTKFKRIEARSIRKRFEQFLSSKLSKAHNIKKIRAKTRKLVKTKLQGLLDRELSNDDIDEFYDLTHDKDFRYLADKIGDSDVYALLDEVKESNGNDEDLINKLQQFMIFSNSSDAADKARKLYNKWVR